KVTWKDSDGNIIQQYTRPRSDLTKVRNDLDAATTALQGLKDGEAALKKERDRLTAREQVVKGRLDDAIQQLAKCLEEKCHHLIVLPLTPVAPEFTPDPVPGFPTGPAVGANTYTPLISVTPAAGASPISPSPKPSPSPSPQPGTGSGRGA